MKPIMLHPDNPHYFLYRGKPAILITSGEHYGAVLNLDFDFIPYLEELRARGFNLTRLFSGTYHEVAGSFDIQGNTLAPAPDRYIAPWGRSSTPGAADGGNKLDLGKWDEAYFRRLKDFCRQADKRGIVVEIVLFCPFYEDILWNVNPMNAANNINGVGSVPKEEVYALKHKDLTAVQEAAARKIVAETGEFENIYYEVCNEPYFGGVTLDWQNHIIAAIVEAESSLPARHLIAQNIANGSAKIENPNPHVSIFNFHYANPPEAVKVNFDLGKVIAFDESGFRGGEDKPYRTEAWEFILAGGGVHDNLDLSFTPEHENGVAKASAPCGGGPTLRSQLKILKDFIYSFNFIKMRPDTSVIKGGVPEGAVAYALTEPGKQYALYIKEGNQANLVLEVPQGRYRAEWLNPRTGAIDKTEEVKRDGGSLTLNSPPYEEDIALKLVSRK